MRLSATNPFMGSWRTGVFKNPNPKVYLKIARSILTGQRNRYILHSDRRMSGLSANYEKKLMSREEYSAALHRTVKEQCVKCVRFVSEEYSLDGNCGIIRDCEYGQQEIGRCRRFKPKEGESDYESIGN